MHARLSLDPSHNLEKDVRDSRVILVLIPDSHNYKALASPSYSVTTHFLEMFYLPLQVSASQFHLTQLILQQMYRLCQAMVLPLAI